MRLLRLAGLSLASVLIFSGQSFGAPITFTHEAVGTALAGTLAGTPFVTSSVEITATGDTTARTSFGGGFFIDHLTASIFIDGQGTFSFVTPTRTFVNNLSSIVGFSRTGISGADLLNGPSAAAFTIWDMLSSIGPITGSGSFLQWSLTPVVTSGGVLEFSSQPATVTFTATVGAVPEPAVLSLTLLGALGLGAARRRFSREIRKSDI